MNNPPTFEAANLEAHRDGDCVLIEVRTAGKITMVFRVDPQLAIEAAHQIERAFHQLQRGARSVDDMISEARNYRLDAAARALDKRGE